MKKANLIGHKFGKLTVISESSPIPAKGRSGYVAWNCQCDCGGVATVRASTLKAGLQKSCGCAGSLTGKKMAVGDRFNRLTTISYNNGKWICKCDCSKITKPILTYLIHSGKRKSCGCIKGEVSRANLKICMRSVRKYDKRTASARRRWKNYCYQDEKCDITFDQWMNLSQGNCYYCGCTPSNNYSYVRSGDKTEDSYFAYNGLDRFDNGQPHIIGNVVPCCIVCNRAKSERSADQFKEYVERLISTFNFNLPKELELPTKGMLVSVKDAYRQYAKNYGEMGLTLQQFYNLSQMPCSYCGDVGINCINTYKSSRKSSQAAIDAAYFYYNGVDRVDNSKGHSLDNVVTACKYCNFGKSNLTLEDWIGWINRVKSFNR
jgi:hypothetical protein